MAYQFPAELAELVEKHLASGEYSSEDEVLLDAMRSLEAQREDWTAIEEGLALRLSKANRASLWKRPSSRSARDTTSPQDAIPVTGSRSCGQREHRSASRQIGGNGKRFAILAGEQLVGLLVAKELLVSRIEFQDAAKSVRRLGQIHPDRPAVVFDLSKLSTTTLL